MRDKKSRTLGAINFFTLKIDIDIVIISIKLHYIHAGKEYLAQGKKKNKATTTTKRKKKKEKLKKLVKCLYNALS